MAKTATARPLCPVCGAPLVVRWQTFAGGSRHVRARCGRCGHLHYLPQTADVKALADAAPPAPVQGRLFGEEGP